MEEVHVLCGAFNSLLISSMNHEITYTGRQEYRTGSCLLCSACVLSGGPSNVSIRCRVLSIMPLPGNNWAFFGMFHPCCLHGPRL